MTCIKNKTNIIVNIKWKNSCPLNECYSATQELRKRLLEKIVLLGLIFNSKDARLNVLQVAQIASLWPHCGQRDEASRARSINDDRENVFEELFHFSLLGIGGFKRVMLWIYYNTLSISTNREWRNGVFVFDWLEVFVKRVDKRRAGGNI